MSGKPIVERITVDEVLDRALIRLLVAPLAENIRTITDDDDEWGDEREVLVHPAEALSVLGLRGAAKRRVAEVFLGRDKSDSLDPVLLRGTREQLLLTLMQEGQVFLLGAFRISGDRAAPESIAVSNGPSDILRIDHIPAVKDIGKLLYARALADTKGKGVRQ